MIVSPRRISRQIFNSFLRLMHLDVSFAGERYRLATTKLKGFVSAKNKLTTQWSELKEQE